MTLNRFVDFLFAIGILVSLLAAGALWVSAQDESEGADGADVGPRKVCQRPPSPSLSMGTSSGGKDNYRIKNVSVSGTYSARVRAVAERGGEEFCYSSWDSASVTITVSQGSSRRIYARWDDVTLREHYIDYEFEWTTKPKPTPTPCHGCQTPTPEPTDTPTPVPPTATPTRDPCHGCQTPTPEPTDTPTPVPPTATPAPTPPGTPSWSAYAHASINSITPRWNAPSAGTNAIDGYDLRYRVDGTGTWSVRSDVSTRTISGDIATTVSSLSSDTEYEVQVRAFDTAGTKGSWSGTKHIRTARIKPVAPPTPNTPSWFKGRPNSSGFTYNDRGRITSATVSMELSWELVSGSGISYRVQQSTGVNQWSTLSTITDTSVILRGLLPESTYIFRVQAQREGGPGVGTLSSGWNQETVYTPIPFRGHQADHTVQYSIETPPTGDHIPDFAAGIATGVSAWNTAAGDGFKTCKVGSCGTSNLDRRTTTIKFPSGADRAVFNPSPIHNDCAASFACVHTHYGSDRHVMSQEVRFEEPAWEAEGGSEFSPPDHYRKVWTNNFALHDTKVDDDELDAKYVYLPWAAMHEFGHTFGLMDLYKLPGGNYRGYLMFEERRAVQAVPQSDVDYLEAVYRNHTPHGR